MKRIINYKIVALAVLTLALTSCGVSSYGGSSYRGVNHYHYGMGGGWGMPYYGDEVIIVEDIDIGMPDDAVDLPMDDW